MAGVKKLGYIQLGQESTAAKGTEVNADFIWRGLGAGGDNLEVVFPDEDVGYLSGVNRSYIPKVEGVLEMEETPCTFEQFPHIMEAGIESESSTQDGTGGYIYEYNFPTTTAPEIATYTVEFGDNQQEYQFTYGFVTDFSLSGSAGEAVNMSANWVGRETDSGTKTAAISLTAVEEVLFQKGKLYIDGTSDTFGTTQATNTWLEFTLDYTTGFQPVYTGDGEKYFTFEKCVGPEVTLDLTFEHDATGVAEQAAWRAGTTRLVRLDFTGSALASTGTVYDNKKLIVDIVGTWESFDPIDEQDGNNVVSGTLRGRYDIVAQDFGKITIVNADSALP
jgi:hypothetical protein